MFSRSRSRGRGISQLGLVVFALALAVSELVQAETLTLVAVADTTLNQDFSTFNMGGHTHVAAGTTARGGLRRGLFRFDLSGVPAAATIESAALELTVPDGNVANPSPFELHRVLVDWTEGNKAGDNGAPAAPGQATWTWRTYQQQMWSAPGGAADVDYVAAASSTSQVGGVGSYIWSGLATDVAQWLAAPDQNFGWLLIGAGEINRTARRFASREAESGAPQLTIQFSVAPLLPGDANGDGRVDLSDFGILKDNFGQSPAARDQGDLNSDGRVDLSDFGVLKDNFGTGGTAVPEPCARSLAALAAMGMFGLRLLTVRRGRLTWGSSGPCPMSPRAAGPP